MRTAGHEWAGPTVRPASRLTLALALHPRATPGLSALPIRQVVDAPEAECGLAVQSQVEWSGTSLSGRVLVPAVQPASRGDHGSDKSKRAPVTAVGSLELPQ